ncbi:MAG: AAA family ATPase [Armatimonadia bacterium]|nr:AAA family ATPase [Armatimonadia bacterium]
MPSTLTDDLNPQQREAVLHGEGPLLIFAGAGTGKTRVLTRRIAHLMSDLKVPPWAILAVTFTNKAAGEMRERVEELAGQASRGMWIGTFHAMCVRLLRAEGERIGIPRDFSIYDTGDQESLMKRVAESLLLGDQDPSFKPKALLAEVSRAKNELLPPREYERTAADHRERSIALAYVNYQQMLADAHALDFDDLIMRAVELLRQVPDVREKYQERFRHVLVDEYQDINFAQYNLVTMLAGAHRNITVVGDDDQSIYRWRGADVRLMLQFEKDFEGANVVKLEQNYRSTQTILDAAYKVIRNNPHRSEKRLFSDLGAGDPIQLYHALSDREEAAWVASRIDSGRRQGTSLGSYAVLFRTNAQSRVFEEAFTDEGIPYQLVGGQKFYDRKEIRDILAYLRVIFNPYDSVSLLRIINTPTRGIGAKAIERLQAAAEEAGSPLLAAALQADRHAERLGRSAAAVGRFGEMMQALIDSADEATADAIIREVLSRSGYEESLLAERSAEAEGRLENVRELISAAANFAERSEDGSLAAFLEHVSLVSDVDGMTDQGQLVTLMTLHAAKGLEFPTVFLVGMEESLFPHARSAADPMALEEERRLCYVGMTRAREKLLLSHAQERMQYGDMQRNLPSRFLNEIPSELLEEEGRSLSIGGTVEAELTAMERRMSGQRGLDLTTTLSRHRRPERPAPKPRPQPQSPAAPAAAPAQVGQGDRVEHAKFGQGMVVSVSADGTATVAFEGAGVKKLSLAHAKLEKL